MVKQFFGSIPFLSIFSLHFCFFPFVFASYFFLVKQFFGSFSFHFNFFAYFTFVFASDFCCFASMWNKRNHAFFSLPSETKCSLQFQFSLPKRKRGRTLVWILHDAKMYEIVRKLHYIFSFLRLCCILCNFLRYVTFTFFNVYVLETLRLVTQNVWWCYMKCDVYV